MIKLNIHRKFKMFTAAIASICILTVSLQSCVDLEEDPTEIRLAPGAYSSIFELDLGVNGIYAQLRNASMWSTFYVNGWSGDDMTTHKTSNKADFREFDQRSVSNANGRTVQNWNNIYGMIAAANNVLKNIEGITLEDAEAQQRLLGEVFFKRGNVFSFSSCTW